MEISNATAEIEAPIRLKEDAKKGRLYTKQPSRHKTNQWYITGAAKRNSKLDTTTNKASSSKTKNTPQNSRQQSGMPKLQGNLTDRVVHCKTCTTLSMWLQDMPALPSRKNVHLTSRQEKLAEQKIRTSVQMPPYKQISIKERSIKSVVLFLS